MMNMVNLNVKYQFVPAYTFGKPNQSVVLAEQEASIKDINEYVIDGNAKVCLDLLPNPSINVYFSGKKLDTTKVSLRKLHGEYIDQKQFEFTFKKYINWSEGYILQANFLNINGPSLVFFPRFDPMIVVGDDDTQIQYVVFHLFNFVNFLGTSTSIEEFVTSHSYGGYLIQHVHFKTDDWAVELRSLSESKTNFKILDERADMGLHT